MRSLLALPLAVVLLALGACASAPEVRTTAPEPGGIAGAYAWVPDRSGMAANPLNNADVWRGAVREAVEKELARRGYPKGELRGARFVMAFHFVVRADDGTVTVVDNYFGYDAPGVRAHLDAYVKANVPTRGRQGTLVIDAVDPVAKRLLWRGSATTAIDPSLTVEARRRAIDRLVASILAEFPGGASR